MGLISGTIRTVTSPLRAIARAVGISSPRRRRRRKKAHHKRRRR